MPYGNVRSVYLGLCCLVFLLIQIASPNVLPKIPSLYSFEMLGAYPGLPISVTADLANGLGTFDLTLVKNQLMNRIIHFIVYL